MGSIKWDWDPQKNLANIAKHGLSFEAASLVFSDPLLMTGDDPCPWEHRMRSIGRVGNSTIIVVHTPPEADAEGHEIGRIISARKTTRRERLAYENG
jgi:uncharacterized DUF497 family protein